jgi:two-component system NarL family response regulator
MTKPMPPTPAANATPSVPQKIRVLIVDDHPLLRLGLRNLIDGQADMQVVGEANDGQEAVTAFFTHHPDVVLMDLRMPGVEGPEAIAQLIARDPEAKVIVLTSYDGDQDVYRAVKAGARGYLLKDTFPEGTLGAIRDVNAGGRLFGPGIAAKMAANGPREHLSSREVAVLELVAHGLTNKEIQMSLSMAEGTLKHHLKRIFEKLDVTDRTEATLVAVQQGIIRLGR